MYKKRWEKYVAILIAGILLVSGMMENTIYLVAEGDKVYEAHSDSMENDINVWDGTVDIDWQGNGTEASPYLITSAEELAGLAYESRNNAKVRGKYFLQTTDIYLNDITDYDNWESEDDSLNVWEPIFDFYGTYMGNNFKIYGMYCNQTSNGLFDRCYGGVVIEDVVLGNSLIYNRRDTSSWNGGIINSLEITSVAPAYIKNCVFDGKIISKGNEGRSGGIVGGITNKGYTNGERKNVVQIKGCKNNAEIRGGRRVGGIVGWLQCVDSKNTDIQIFNCLNHGKIEGKDEKNEDMAGGIIGLISDNRDGRITLKNCCKG